MLPIFEQPEAQGYNNRQLPVEKSRAMSWGASSPERQHSWPRDPRD